MVFGFCSCNGLSRSLYFLSIILVTDLTNLKQIVLGKKKKEGKKNRVGWSEKKKSQEKKLKKKKVRGKKIKKKLYSGIFFFFFVFKGKRKKIKETIFGFVVFLFGYKEENQR